MIYCDQCGAVNDLGNAECSRCGAKLVAVESEPSLHGARAARQSDAVGGAASLAADLKLPDWLREAAESTPHDPGANIDGLAGFPPVGFVVERSMAAAQPSDAPDERSVPTLPTESEPPLRGPMPEWLRGQSEASAAPVDMPPAASLNATDTSSFITENDLPEWIRQIADADAAKQAEEQRRAAESALAASQEQPAAPVRVPLPGESASAQPASNPWLSRRDAASAQHAWTSVAQPASVPASQSVEVAGTGDSEIATAGKEAELVTASSTQPTAPAAPGKRSRKPSRLARSRATGSESDADVVDTPKRKLPRPDTGGDGANRTLRLVLLVVIIVVLGLALAFVV